MPGKGASASSKAISALAGAVAAFAARKLLIMVWKQITGKEPPDHPEDPQVALREALTWGIVVGAGMSVARMLATRAATVYRHEDAGEDA
jgi:Protein of unknown function (DUF4235)